MENKNQKILKIPEGFELDLKNSSKDKIVLKEKVLSWDNFGKVEGWYIESYSTIKKAGAEIADDENKNTFPSKEEAEAALAISQLLQWRNRVIGDWRPDFKSDEHKYAIMCYKDEIMIRVTDYLHFTFTFQNHDQAHEFMKNHKELLEQAKLLL